MTRIPKWTWLVATAVLLAFAGCADNDDDNGDDGGGGVGGSVGGNDGGDGGDNDGGEASGEARGSPGWGFLGAIGAVAAVGYVVRKRFK